MPLPSVEAGVILVANPAAGGGRVGRRWDAVVSELRGVFPGLEARRTERQGHAGELAAEAVRAGETEVLSLGGDGTHSEVAAGIASVRSDGSVALGVLHGGTGGDFSRLFGDGTLVERAAHLAGAGSAPIDLGRVAYETDGGTRERVFLNEASVGMSAEVCARVNRSSKRFGAKGTFLTQTVRTLARYKPVPLVVEADGAVLWDREITTVVVANGRWAGGGMKFTPEARLADGALDVCVIRPGGPVHSLRLPRHLYRGSTGASDLVRFGRGAEVVLRCPSGALLIEADGEVLGRTPIRCTVLPSAVRLMGADAAWL